MSTDVDNALKPEDWAGYRAHTHPRKTGGLTLVVLVHAEDAGLDDDPNVKWMLVCDTHSTCCGWPTQTAAESYLAHPDDWCEECRTIVEAGKSS